MKAFVARLAVLAVAASTLVAPALGSAQSQSDVAEVATTEPIELVASPTTGMHMLYATPNGIGCRLATVDESLAASKQAEVPLHVIKGERANKTAAGLTIVLRATDQLERFPQAKEAFIRAAADWESRIASEITIIVNVDYGSERFGEPYDDPNIIGSTNAQDIGSSTAYPNVRAKLIERASSAGETAVYNSLPASSVPTDKGGVAYVIAGSANFRALGLANAVANPSIELGFGPVPSIGFNSNFSFDFDPSNGIDGSRTDFNAVVLHEIGHVLGFESLVGLKELDSGNPNILTVLDLFRFRPGTSSTDFGSASRVLSSGGTQVFFDGSRELQLSTGRPDGSGGDGQQASHWKDDFFAGNLIGLMDPTIDLGQREEITDNDLMALDLIGYRFAGQSPVTIGGLVGDLDGDVLKITGTAASTEAAIVSVDVDLLDQNGGKLTTLPTEALAVGGSGQFTLQLDGLNDVPAATRARLTVADADGNESAATVVDFGSVVEAGAPAITKVKLNGSKLKLTGTGFTSQMQIEVNGVAMALPPGSKVKPTGKKATVDISSLPLRSGANRIRFLIDGHDSNIVVITRS